MTSATPKPRAGQESGPLVGAKRSAEMKEAMRLHEAGLNAHRGAARQAGVLPTSFYRLLRKLRDEAALAAPVRPRDASQ